MRGLRAPVGVRGVQTEPVWVLLSRSSSRSRSASRSAPRSVLRTASKVGSRSPTKGCVRGCFEGGFWAFGGVKISFKVFVERRCRADGRKSNNFLRDGASKSGPSARSRLASRSSSRLVLVKR